MCYHSLVIILTWDKRDHNTRVSLYQNNDEIFSCIFQFFGGLLVNLGRLSPSSPPYVRHAGSAKIVPLQNQKFSTSMISKSVSSKIGDSWIMLLKKNVYQCPSSLSYVCLCLEYENGRPTISTFFNFHKQRICIMINCWLIYGLCCWRRMSNNH